MHSQQSPSECPCQLNLTDVSYSIDGKSLLSCANLSVASTGVTAVMGFNGAGKSILLKIMHGILKPQTGQVNWFGNDNESCTQPVQAMVFQKPVLLRRTTTANVMFALNTSDRNTLSSSQKQTICDALLNRVGLADKATQPARLLSGGEQQRLALARALAIEPAVLFLDEATASLDPASAAIIENIVAEQSRHGTKVIMVTHDTAQATRLADTIIFLYAGMVAEHASSSEFFDKPESSAAQAYLGGRLYNPIHDEHRT